MPGGSPGGAVWTPLVKAQTSYLAGRYETSWHAVPGAIFPPVLNAVTAEGCAPARLSGPLESRVPVPSGINPEKRCQPLSLFRLTPVRVPNNGQKAKASPKTNRVSDLRNHVAGMKFGSQGLKVGVVLIFTLCWLLIILARSQAPRDPASFEGSSL